MKVLFESIELVQMLGQIAQRGFRLHWKVVPASKSGGTWVAQVSREGKYIRVQHRNPVEAVGRLINLCTQNKWREWGDRTWKRRQDW